MIEIEILYLSLHNQLKKKFGFNQIPRKELWIKLRKHSQVPLALRDAVLNEMCKMGLLKRINRDNFQLLDLKIDIEKDSRLFFDKVFNAKKTN